MDRLTLHPGGLMPLIEHLAELRRALVISLFAFLLAAGALMFYANQILLFLLEPLYQLHITPIQTRPMEYLFAMLKIATLAGIFLALPVFLWQGWGFIKPALKPKEGRQVFWAVPLAIVLFAGGVVFAYLTVYQAALHFLIMLGSGVVVPYISVGEYLNFTLSFLLPFGLIFEMPIVSVFLTRLGLITPAFLAKKRKYAFFFIFLLAIILIPDPSLFCQSLLALPMYLLFEISVLLSRLVQRRQKRLKAQSGALPEAADG